MSRKRYPMEGAAPESPSIGCQPASLGIGQPQPPNADLLSQNPVLLDQVLDDLLLLPVDPA